MNLKRFFPFLLPFLVAVNGYAQDFSGLENKNLERTEDLRSMVETGIASLLNGRRSEGSIESIKVLYDSEHELKLQVSYKGIDGGILKLFVANGKKQKMEDVKGAEISVSGRQSPAECVLTLNENFPSGQLLETPFLKIEYTKDGFVPLMGAVFSLNKKWKTDIDPENVVVRVKPQPTGSATLLRENEVKDATPSKIIRFEDKLYYNPKLEKKILIQPIRAGNPQGLNFSRQTGGLYATGLLVPSLLFAPERTEIPGNTSDNISGTWNNTDAATRGITKMIITDNNQIQVFGKCSPTDCDWGKAVLKDNGNNVFAAVYNMGFVITTLELQYAGNQLTAAVRDEFKDSRGVQAYKYTFQKNAQVLLLAMPVFSIKDYASRTATAPPTTSTVPEGPGNNSLYLWTGLRADGDFENPQDISTISMHVFPDKNDKSGVYYFLPANYHLKYEYKPNPEKGYNMNILYGSRTANDAAPVRMSARLTAGVSNREMDFVKTLLKAGGLSVKELKLMPLRENPSFSFQSYLSSQFNIPQDKISVESSTDLLNDIRVSWQTDANTKEFIQSALMSGEGIGASVVLKPKAEGIIDQQVPVIINLADNKTLGKITLDPTTWRTKNWRNATAYPLQLKSLNVLKVSSKENTPVIYSWSLNNAVVPSKAQVAFDPSLVPSWLDNQESAMIWIDYAVMDCKPCDQKVIDAITGGVSGNMAQMVKFTIPPAVFDSLHAAYFLVNIRSKMLDPNGEELKELPSNLRITKEMDKEFTAGPLFVPAGGSIAFEYKITLATADGEFVKNDNWIPAAEKEVLLGKTKMKELFPNR